MQQDAEDQQGRVGPFVTYVERVRPDGAVARWESRDHRKHLKAGLAAGSTWWAPRARGWWIAVLFAVGSLLLMPERTQDTSLAVTAPAPSST